MRCRCGGAVMLAVAALVAVGASKVERLAQADRSVEVAAQVPVFVPVAPAVDRVTPTVADSYHVSGAVLHAAVALSAREAAVAVETRAPDARVVRDVLNVPSNASTSLHPTLRGTSLSMLSRGFQLRA